MNSLWQQFINETQQMWDKLTGVKPANTEESIHAKWNQIATNWTHFHTKAQKQWPKLTAQELIEVNGRYETLATKIQERYGIQMEEAHQEIDLWIAKVKV